MSVSHPSRIIVVAAAIVITTAATAWADPPARVGRLSDVEGTVSFHAADQTDWSPATLNYPVTTGTSFWTEPDSKAEIQIGASEVRLDQGTWVDVTQLDDNTTQVTVNQGVVNVHVHALPPGGISVMTPKGQVDLIQPGSYDINAGSPTDDNTPAAQMQFTVLEGVARYEGPQSSLDVQAGEAAIISGDPVTVQMAEGETTAFDDWALAREHRESEPSPAQAQAPNAPPPVVADMTGAQDLGAYGQWAATPDYGQVWYPTQVATDWAPYQNGHWAYVEPWGWTWIDDAPWGFAPFHYGRWARIHDRWGWVPVVPGAVVARPVYAPALVAFVGGDGFGVTISAGGPTAAVGWVPLAPYEVYRPWYHASRTYVHRVNVINVRRTEVVTEHLAPNRGAPQGMTITHLVNRNATVVVPAQAFAHAAPVQRARVQVPRDQVEHLRVDAGRQMRTFQPTPEARRAKARPDIVQPQVANAHAQVAAKPVAYHPDPAPVHPQAVQPAPGPRGSNGQAARPGAAVRQNAAVTSAPQKVQPHPQPARPAAAAPQPRPQPQPNAQQPHPQPAAAAPAPRPQPAPQPNATAPRPAAAAPQPQPQPNVQQPRPQPAAAASAPRPQAAPRGSQPVHPTTFPAAQTRAPVQPRPAQNQAAPPRPQTAAPAQAQVRPQMQVQRPAQQTHLQATPQGWKRQEQPHAAAPAPHAAEPEKKKE